MQPQGRPVETWQHAHGHLHISRRLHTQSHSGEGDERRATSNKDKQSRVGIMPSPECFFGLMDYLWASRWWLINMGDPILGGGYGDVGDVGYTWTCWCIVQFGGCWKFLNVLRNWFYNIIIFTVRTWNNVAFLVPRLFHYFDILIISKNLFEK